MYCSHIDNNPLTRLKQKQNPKLHLTDVSMEKMETQHYISPIDINGVYKYIPKSLLVKENTLIP